MVPRTSSLWASFRRMLALAVLSAPAQSWAKTESFPSTLGETLRDYVTHAWRWGLHLLHGQGTVLMSSDMESNAQELPL